jgi:hypothetical protein
MTEEVIIIDGYGIHIENLEEDCMEDLSKLLIANIVCSKGHEL